jgi:hypothetical protein
MEVYFSSQMFFRFIFLCIKHFYENKKEPIKFLHFHHSKLMTQISLLKFDEKTGIYSCSKGNRSGTEESTLQLDFKPFMYFEVQILTNTTASIGFAPSKWNNKGFCGKTDQSVGYFNDGKVFDDFATSYATIASYSTNDIIGALWNTTSQEIFFTKNGKSLYNQGGDWIGARSIQLSGKLLPTSF